ncbi:MAG TPA: ankyrin repeat domain-containing protein [Burkholderiales bacterium]|nr:ankyrin repeat domain-containing protein [Burkholderiales bacterium]
MIRRIAAVLACLLIVVGLAGCAGVGGGAADNDRIVNAIGTDDVYTVRGAVQNGGLSPNARLSVEAYPDGAPIIALAARAASLEVMRFLISSGADVNARTPVNETPLMLAAFFFDEVRGNRSFDRHERAVRLLVESGADLENYYYYTPLAYAAYQDNERVVRYLLQRGAKVNGAAQQGGTYSNTPLMMAAIQGHERMVRMLLAAGADADVRVYGGHTAAEFAEKYNHHGLAQLLQCAQRQYGTLPVGVNCRAMLGFSQH